MTNYSIVVEELDAEHVLVYVPEDFGVIDPGDVNFFNRHVEAWQPDGPGSWTPVPVQRPDTGELRLPTFCDIVHPDEVDDWKSDVADKIDAEVEASVKAVTKDLQHSVDLAIEYWLSGYRTIDQFAGSPEDAEPGEVYAYLDEDGVHFGAWAFHPAARFDQSEADYLDVEEICE